MEKQDKEKQEAARESKEIGQDEPVGELKGLHETKGLIHGPYWNPEDVGTLIMSVESGKSTEETRWMQEHHNARHALWELDMAVYYIEHGQPIATLPRKANVTLAHLSCLREFIQDKEFRLKVIVARLIETLLSEFPCDNASWTHFIHAHWYLLRSFAEHYGEHEKCFSVRRYDKICDVVYGRQYVRLWWWKLRLERYVREMRRLIRNCSYNFRNMLGVEKNREGVVTAKHGKKTSR